MNKHAQLILKQLILNTKELSACTKDIERAFEIIKECYRNGNKVMVCGNGGSASDSEHIVGELMKSFNLERKICKENKQRLIELFPEDGEYLAENLQGALSAISLVSQISIASAYINDVAPDMVFAQQVYGYIKEGDVVIGLSTSGTSKNVMNALKVAKAFGAKTIAMTGAKGGMVQAVCDVTLKVPADITYRVQEYHIVVYHGLCAMIEAEFFSELE